MSLLLRLAIAATFVSTVALVDAQGGWADTEAIENSACVADRKSDWTAQEQWVWSQLCANRDADLDAAGTFGPKRDPAQAAFSDPSRRLRARFVASILLDEPYVSRVSTRPIRIAGAWFDEPLSLPNTSMRHALFIEDSRFDKTVDLGGARTNTLGFDRSVFAEVLILNSAIIDGPLDLRDVRLTEVDLVGARIGGNVELDGSTLTGLLDMNSAAVSGAVHLRRASTQGVDLVGSVITSTIESEQSKIQGDFALSSATVGGALLLGDTQFTAVRLISARVTGPVWFPRSTISREAVLDGAKLDAELFLTRGTFGVLRIVGATVEGTLAVNGSQIAELNLRNSTVKKDLRLAFDGSDVPDWIDGGVLDLRSTSVGAVDDAPTAWPRTIRLAGFSSERPRGSTTPEGQDIASRSSAWYRNWLTNDDTDEFSAQPYLHLEQTLRDAGERDVADAIAIQRIDREWRNLSILSKGIRLLYRITVGYGYKPQWAVYWVALLLIVGWVTAQLQPEFRVQHRIRSSLLFSIDHVVPLITFRKANADADLGKMAPWSRRTFCVLKAAGYVLGAFLVAALTKVTDV